MDLEDAGSNFDAVLADAGPAVVKSGVRMPRMNSIVERWIQTCRRGRRLSIQAPDLFSEASGTRSQPAQDHDLRLPYSGGAGFRLPLVAQVGDAHPRVDGEFGGRAGQDDLAELEDVPAVGDLQRGAGILLDQ